MLIILSTATYHPLAAQIAGSKGVIEGRVVDASGAPFPGVTVSAIQASSGLERETLTDANGFYRVASLIPGTYDLRIEATSVSTTVKELTVHVGAVLQVTVRLNRQSSPESLAISASILSLADSEMTQVIPPDAIRDLPINGRRFQEFATLTPAVMAVGQTLGQLSFVGQRGVNSNVLLDGNDYNQPFLGGIRGGDRSELAFTVPQSAIQEFQTVTSGYSAEYGRSTGGILNAVTKSGTNGLHGEAFYLGRNRALASKNPFRQEALEDQKQFGGGIGGSLLPERLFFFAAAEQQLASFPRQVRFAALDSIERTAAIAPAYDFFRSQERFFEQTNNATAALGRLDYRVGSHVITGRYTWSRNNGTNAAALGTSLNPATNQSFGSNGEERDTIRTVAAQVTSVLGPELLNDLRVQTSYEFRNRLPNAASPFINAGPIGQVGTSPWMPLENRDRRTQVADSLTVLRGRHALKVGFDYSYIRFMQWYGDNQFGSFQIASSDPVRVLSILSAPNRFDDPLVTYRRQVGGLRTERGAHQPAFFVQDSWKVHPRFTVNAGLRWEAQINPTPQTGNSFLYENVANFPFPLGRVDPSRLHNRLNQFAPRAGFAWNPEGGRTVIRAQAGIFYGQTPFILYAAPMDSFSSTASDLSLEIAPNARGTVYRQFANAGYDLGQGSLDNLRVFTIPEVWMNVAGQPNQFANANVTTTSGDNFRNPRAVQVTLGLQHQVATGLFLDYQMNYVNTVHLARNVDYNVPAPFVREGDLSLRPFFGLRSGTLRPNPNIGQVLVRDSSGRSRYAGQSFRVQWQRSQFTLAANYTLAFNKSDDDSERAISGISYQNPFNLRSEYNWSSLDVRHLASGYVLWSAPWGVQLTSLFRYHSGLPIDATTGGDTSELLSGANGSRPLERPGQFLLRNSFRNQPYQTVDIRLLKSFGVTENAKLQFSAEVFNVLDRDNVAFVPATGQTENSAFRYGLGLQPNGQLAPIDPGFLKLQNQDGTYDASMTFQQGSPRTAQLGVRLIF